MSYRRDTGLELTRIHHLRWGDARPKVLLLHPIGFEAHTWDRIGPALSQKADVVALDLPGHGESDKPRDADYSLPALADRVLRFLDELGWERAIFVGNSLGGGTSLAVALQAPERVAGMVLIDSVGFRWGLPPLGRLSFMPGIPTVCRVVPNPLMKVGLGFARYGFTGAAADRCERTGKYLRDPDGCAAFFETLRQLYSPGLETLSQRYTEIRRPALVLHGEQDFLVPRANSERIAASISGAAFATIPRCGHFPQEERPDTLLQVVLPFIEQLLRAW
jgi:pimeloyl-ACP methyl ester carboxylesterase